MHRICLHTLFCAAFFAFAALLPAQPGHPLADSLRAAVLRADSVKDLRSAVDLRIQLAGQEGRGTAIVLLKQAAALADSAQRTDLGTMAHRMLAERLAQSGDAAMAFREAMRADSLDRLREAQELRRVEANHAHELGRMAAQRDSIAEAARVQEQVLGQAIADVLQRAGSWMIAAIAALLTGVLLVIMVFLRTGRITGRMRATIEELRKELEALKRAPPIRTEAPPKPPEATVHAVDEAMKPVVAGLFEKGAPERMATLRDARLRGDKDKVLRVVASLKPQLLSFDADRFGPLIARLRAADAAADSRQWNADLDALEAGVKELLEGGGLH